MTNTWPQDEVGKFLELYRSEQIIWNPKFRDHKDKNKVSDAWNRISDAMGIPICELKRKKESLMSAFRVNLKKKKDSIRSGTGREEIYTPSWPFFDVMESFLKDVYQCNSVINTEDGATTSIEDEDFTTSQLLDTTSENDENLDPITETEKSKIKVPVQRRRSRNPPELDDTNKEMKKTFLTLNNLLSKQQTKYSEDDCELYGKLLAKKLRQFTEIEKHELMYEIDGILLRKRQTSLSRQRVSHVVQSPSQIILSSTKRPVSGTRISVPLYTPRPTSSLSTYSASTSANDTDRPPSNQTDYSPSYLFHNSTTSEEQFPVDISIPEQSHSNLETQTLQSQSILHQAYISANIDDSTIQYYVP